MGKKRVGQRSMRGRHAFRKMEGKMNGTRGYGRESTIPKLRERDI